MTFHPIALLLPSSWTIIGASSGNHLWQSTVFAGVVWLLTVFLRKNQAQSRYVLWLIASAKFLIPFSLLMNLGSHLPWSRTPAVAQPAVFLAMETLGEPFAPVNPTHVASLPTPSALQDVLRLLPALLLLVWFVGSLAVLLVRYLRWRRLNSARRAVLPLQSGRELEALRGMERAAHLRQPINLILSQPALEPGILGIFRPALLLPAGIPEKLTDAQLESVIAHELCHVRRHDNLAAALHMLVEAVFWFHPLVWWIGARLVDERERACDEEVVRLGSDPQVYAESILKVCEFYAESPPFCAAGVTGSNLKKRIEAIMRNRIARNLEWSKKLLLTAAGVVAVAGPLVFGLLHTTQGHAKLQTQNNPAVTPTFESVSVKPNTNDADKTAELIRAIRFEPDRFMATNVTLHGLIAMAYGAGGSEILGGPDWVRSENYDIEWKLDTPVIDELSKLGPDQRLLEQKRILQALLANRFRLALHRETREPPAYVLAIAKDGFKLQEAKPGDTYLDGFTDPQGRPLGAGALFQPGPCKLVGQGVHIVDLAKTLSMNYLGGRTVVDQTGLWGVYDFTLDCHTAFMERGESVLTVLPEQLGLELKLLDNLVIDSAEKPSEN